MDLCNIHRKKDPTNDQKFSQWYYNGPPLAVEDIALTSFRELEHTGGDVLAVGSVERRVVLLGVELEGAQICYQQKGGV